MSPKISVVVPTHNSGQFVEATMDSILRQTFVDFELIVADHSSTDDTWIRLQKFTKDQRVRLVRTASGGGASTNWRRVTDEARGEYLKLVCGDDLLAPSCLSAQATVLDDNRSVALVSCRRSLVDSNGEVVFKARGLGGLRGTVLGRSAVRRTVIRGTNIFGEPACVLMRRTTFESAGGWDDSQPYVIDQATFSNILRFGDFHALDQVLASFRLSPAQWSVQLARQQSDQVVAFHHRLAAENAGLLSRSDLVRGDAMARTIAFGRRITYWKLDHRTRSKAATPTGVESAGMV